jgi:hypothetical protein
VSGTQKARATMYAPIMSCDLFFISWNFEDRDGPARVDANSVLLFDRFRTARQFRMKTSLCKPRDA